MALTQPGVVPLPNTLKVVSRTRPDNTIEPGFVKGMFMLEERAPVTSRNTYDTKFPILYLIVCWSLDGQIETVAASTVRGVS